MTHPTDDQSEQDVHEDPKVASSRAGKDGADGTYVGETGAEARSQAEG